MRLKLLRVVGQVSTFWQIRVRAALSKARDIVLAKTRDVQLHDRTGTTVGRRKSFIAPGADKSIEPGFAIAHDRARGISGGSVHGMLDPALVTGRDQEFDVGATESFGVGIIDNGAHRQVLKIKHHFANFTIDPGLRKSLLQ